MEASDLVEIQELTNLCFKSNNYLQNFPQVFKSQNSQYFLLLRNNNRLVSFCSIYPTYFIQKNLLQANNTEAMSLVKGYCIGSVCTHPDFRNKGFASKILTQAETLAGINQAEFVYLFSEQNILYENAGFRFCGETYIANFEQNSKFLKICKNLKRRYSNFKITTHTNLGKIEESLAAKIWNFIVQNSKSCESILSYLEFKDILHIKNLALSILTHQQKVCGVCFLNKGDDFINVVHGLYYLQRDYAILLLENFVTQKNSKKKFHFFPGGFHHEFSELFNYQIVPNMYVKILAHSQNLAVNQVFVRSLQGT